MLTSDHTKTIHIDDKVAFTGGMNIGREYRSEWHDLMLKLSGPITGRIKKDFEESWSHAGPAGDLGYFLKSLMTSEDYSPAEPPESC